MIGDFCEDIRYLICGSIRLIFLACNVVLATSQVMYLIALSKASLINGVAPGTIAISHYLLSVGLILVAALGAYAAILGEKHLMTKFLKIAALYTVVAIVVVYFAMGPAKADAINKEFLVQFKKLADDYNWDKNSPSKNNEATRVIDEVQSSFKCCGSGGFEFWKDYQKPPITADEWPGSCCDQPNNQTKLCHKSEGPLRGHCLGKLSKVEMDNALAYALFILAQIVTCLVGLCVKRGINQQY